METKRIYLDYTATTPLDPRVLEAMLPYFNSTFGNASSIHSFGREAKAALEGSREKIAGFIGARPSEIVFTSGGTESDNAALFGAASAGSDRRRKQVVVSSIEHHAVLHTAAALQELGFDATFVPVDRRGFVDPEEVRRAVRDDTLIVSIIHANNEIGTIQNLPVIAAIVHEKGALFHTDAVQSFGKIPFSVAGSGVDLASFSAHKIYGPKGIGALFIKRGIEIGPTFHGGSQERNRRPGTESIPLIAGFARAAEIAVEEMEIEARRLTGLNKMMRKNLLKNVQGVIFNSPDQDALPNILNASIDSSKVEIDGEALIISLDLEGIAVTSGSACSSGSLQPSHVIKALGRDDATTKATVRFSFGRFTTEEDIVKASEIFGKIVARTGKVPG